MTGYIHTSLVCYEPNGCIALISSGSLGWVWIYAVNMPADLQTVQPTGMLHCRCICVVDISNPTSLVLFSIPGIPGAHQLTGVVLIGMDGG